MLKYRRHRRSFGDSSTGASEGSSRIHFVFKFGHSALSAGAWPEVDELVNLVMASVQMTWNVTGLFSNRPFNLTNWSFGSSTDPLFAHRLAGEVLYFAFGAFGTAANVMVLVAVSRLNKFKKDVVLLIGKHCLREDTHTARRNYCGHVTPVTTILQINRFHLREAGFRRHPTSQSSLYARVAYLGFTVASLLVSLGYVTSSVRRTIIELTGDFPMTSLQCFVQGIHIFFFETGVLTSCFDLVLMTIDRAIILHLSRWSHKFSTPIAVKVVSLLQAITFVDFCVVFALALIHRDTTTYSANCFYEDTVGSVHYEVHFFLTMIASIAIVFIYAVIVISMWVRKRSGRLGNSNLRRRDLIVTKRIGILVVPIILLHLVPFSIYSLIGPTGPYYNIISIYIFIFGCFDSTVNAFIYAWFHPDVKKLICKFRHWRLRQVQVSVCKTNTMLQCTTRTS
ncbi:unnamed protein product [Soboliphyme baturini]|uniref:G_PROTEIN_RECEP_F1_2 domain-containing protein n=1 Tax=Soboliphyme baturini TaxID=241478 RepID=A0A183IIC3_9BILA|nr:unnamed protein product [Soboliphyme baturini]